MRSGSPGLSGCILSGSAPRWGPSDLASVMSLRQGVAALLLSSHLTLLHGQMRLSIFSSGLHADTFPPQLRFRCGGLGTSSFQPSSIASQLGGVFWACKDKPASALSVMALKRRRWWRNVLTPCSSLFQTSLPSISTCLP